MKRDDENATRTDDAGVISAAPLPESRRAWREPKLTFVEPALTKEGDFTELTGQGFFGTFIP